MWDWAPSGDDAAALAAALAKLGGSGFCARGEPRGVPRAGEEPTVGEPRAEERPADAKPASADTATVPRSEAESDELSSVDVPSPDGTRMYSTPN